VVAYPHELNGMVAGISNFWTDDIGTSSITGDEFPSILRIYGYLNVLEKVNLRKLFNF